MQKGVWGSGESHWEMSENRGKQENISDGTPAYPTKDEMRWVGALRASLIIGMAIFVHIENRMSDLDSDLSLT
jgi:hypothetical protein